MTSSRRALVALHPEWELLGVLRAGYQNVREGIWEVVGLMMGDTRQTIERFNEAFNRFDLDEVMSLMTDDVVFVNTAGPDGERFEGRDAVRAYFAGAFETTASGRFVTEEMFTAEDRCVVLWRFDFDRAEPASGHVAGIDVFRVQGGRVSEKLSYIRSGRLDEIVKAG